MQFRFEPILRINKNRENLLLKSLGEINSHLQTQEDRQEFMHQTARQSKETLNARLREPTDINTLILYDNFLEGIRTQSHRQKKIISEVREKLEDKRKEVIEAGRKRRTMEILKEKDFLKYRKEMMKEETALMDEVASNMWRMNP